MRALGIETDSDIYKYIVYDLSDVDMLNTIKHSMDKAYEESVKLENGETLVIRTQEQAIQYLMTKMKNNKMSKYKLNNSYLNYKTTIKNNRIY
jgi:DNA-directed RNA polymerase beta subunit